MQLPPKFQRFLAVFIGIWTKTTRGKHNQNQTLYLLLFGDCNVLKHMITYDRPARNRNVGIELKIEVLNAH